MPFVTDQLFRLVPGSRGRRNITFFILCFPGKPLTHGMEGAEIGEMRIDQITLTGIHTAFDKLHHSAWQLMGDTTKNHAKGGR